MIAGSDFLADTQSRPDTRGRVSIQTILAGADHIDAAVWQAAAGLASANAEHLGLRTAERLAGEGRPILLNLGRWEPGCYKNSEAAYEILRQVMVEHGSAALLILADPKTTPIPADLEGRVFPIGFPDDQELVAIMRTDVGISVSLWEGHNLPLSEMQWLERNGLAFDVAGASGGGAGPVVFVPGQRGDGGESVCDFVGQWAEPQRSGRSGWRRIGSSSRGTGRRARIWPSSSGCWRGRTMRWICGFRRCG